jgi:peptide/nickel transport system substrate-binding protein
MTEEIQTFSVEVIRKRQFEIVLFGYITGIPADLFSFWHSSVKIDPGLNISEYGNITVDKNLETIKRTTETEEIEASYLSLQSEIQKDRPAVFLFSPKYIYLTPKELTIPLKPSALATPEDRFGNIESWYIKTEKILPFFVN